LFFKIQLPQFNSKVLDENPSCLTLSYITSNLKELRQNVEIFSITTNSSCKNSIVAMKFNQTITKQNVESILGNEKHLIFEQ